MKEANDHYIEDSLWEVENFLQSVSIDKNLLDERTLDDMAYHYYKNYYDYEMDEEYCKHYKEMHPEADFGITCEMRSVVNQQLAQDSMASDFVISRNIASLMMSQIAENRELRQIFEGGCFHSAKNWYQNKIKRIRSGGQTGVDRAALDTICFGRSRQ